VCVLCVCVCMCMYVCFQAVDGETSLIQRRHRNHSYDDLSAVSHLATPMVGAAQLSVAYHCVSVAATTTSI